MPVATIEPAQKKIPKPLTVDAINRMRITIPACPAVFVRLLKALEDPDSPELPQIINSDPSLSSEVIRVSNSAFYGASKRIFSVNDAVIRLGFNEIFSIATALKAREVFRGGKWDDFRALLWEHAVKVATASKLLARRFNSKAVETIYTAGLLHDLGKLLYAEVLPTYGEIAVTRHGEALMVEEKNLFGTEHSELGGELLRFWKLPDTLASLVEGHHKPAAPGDTLKLCRDELSLANHMAHCWETTFENALKQLTTNVPPMIGELGMDNVGYYALLNEWRKETEKLMNL